MVANELKLLGAPLRSVWTKIDYHKQSICQLGSVRSQQYGQICLKVYASGADEHKWVANYFDQVSTDPETKQTEAEVLCVGVVLKWDSTRQIKSCAIDALKTCVVTCDADSVDPHTESECATACLQIHNETIDAPDWAAKYYAQTVNDEYQQCMEAEAETVLDSGELRQSTGGCVSECQAQEKRNASHLGISSSIPSKIQTFFGLGFARLESAWT